MLMIQPSKLASKKQIGTPSYLPAERAGNPKMPPWSVFSLQFWRSAYIHTCNFPAPCASQARACVLLQICCAVAVKGQDPRTTSSHCNTKSHFAFEDLTWNSTLTPHDSPHLIWALLASPQLIARHCSTFLIAWKLFTNLRSSVHGTALTVSTSQHYFVLHRLHKQLPSAIVHFKVYTK